MHLSSRIFHTFQLLYTFKTPSLHHLLWSLWERNNGKARQEANMKVILKNYVFGFPKETDMQLIIGTVKLNVPEGCKYGIVVKKNSICHVIPTSPEHEWWRFKDIVLSLLHRVGSVSYSCSLIWLFIFHMIKTINFLKRM